MCHSLVLPQLTQYIVVSHCFLGDLDIFMDWARGPFEDTTFKTIRAINYPSCRETFLHVRKFDHLWYIASDQYNSEINEIMPWNKTTFLSLAAYLSSRVLSNPKVLHTINSWSFYCLLLQSPWSQKRQCHLVLISHDSIEWVVLAQCSSKNFVIVSRTYLENLSDLHLPTRVPLNS